jgi:hypothetical protein
MSDFALLTDRADILHTQWREAPRPPPGGATLEVERFALTANNFTYAKLGETLGYWRHFPAPEGWGRMPVWGLARIAESAHPGLREGERVFGFLPIATRLTLQPEVRGALRFVDAAPHRADQPAAYNEYALIDRDPDFDGERADAYIALRPLFVLGFFLAEWLMANRCFGADRVIVSSASSKAALALAHELGGRVATLGLTSPRHISAVAAWGLFDEVRAYDEIVESGSAVFVDFAGDPGRAAALRERLGERLLRVVPVGATARPASHLHQAELFFAPSHIPRLKALWGAERLRRELAGRSAAFVAAASERLTFTSFVGRREIDRVYRESGRGEGAADVVPLLSGLRKI